MPAPTKGARLGGSPAHERLILANLATALFEHGRITTTHAKARRLRPMAERLITFAKRGDLHARRQVMAVIGDKGVVHELFTQIGPRFAQREGGYTRIIKRGPRKGDQAPMAVIELVESLTVAQEAVGEAEKARSTRFAQSSKVAKPKQEKQIEQVDRAEDQLPTAEANDDAKAPASAKKGAQQQEKAPQSEQTQPEAKTSTKKEAAPTSSETSLDQLMQQPASSKDGEKTEGTSK